MRHLRVFLLTVWPCFAVLLALAPALERVAGQTVDDSSLEVVSSQRYIVIDADTGEVFAENDPNVRAGMASVTKIFTAIVSLERAPLDFQITAQESDLFDSASTTMPGFVPGNVYTVEDLLYGMMLQSGNDAAEALARGIAQEEGDSPAEAVERFMGWVNAKADELGLTNTHLVNPHGLSDPQHYSTPRDLAAFMMYAIENPTFMEIASATQFTVSTGEVMFSINRAPQFIPDHVGGKTGFDFDTGYCLVELQQREGSRLITVTIDGVAPDVWYQDHAILADYGFSALQARLDSGEPIAGEVISFARGQTDEPAGNEQAQVLPTATLDVRNATGDDGPRPVLVDGTPLAAVPGDESDGISGHWLMPLLIAGVVAASLLIRCRATFRLPRRSTPPGSAN